jgi:hypothetical protein
MITNFKLFESINIQPDIFTHTIYRLPSKLELKNINEYNLTANEIIDGFIYTIVGRGILTPKYQETIIKAIEMLVDMFPDNEEYKLALKKINIRFNR